MAEIPDAVYEAAAVALHDADCGDSICSAGIIHSCYGAGARAVVDTVAPLLLAEGRRQAAEAILLRAGDANWPQGAWTQGWHRGMTEAAEIVADGPLVEQLAATAARRREATE